MKLLNVLVGWASPGIAVLVIALGLVALTALLAWLALKGLVVWLTQD
jgi:hypothetical protein